MIIDELLTMNQPGTVQVDEALLHFEVTDIRAPWATSRPAVVFCHGVGANCDYWAEWLPALAAEYRVVRFDLRGFGRSGKTPGRAGWSMDLLADDVLAVADAAGVDEFHLVGESAGGTVAMLLAARGEKRVRSLTVSNAAHRGGSINRVQEWRAFIAEQGIGAWSDQMMERRFTRGVLSEEKREWFSRVQESTEPEPLLAIADALIDADLSTRLPQITVPTLLFAPGLSPFVSVDLMREIAELIPSAQLRVFPDVRHGLPLSHGSQCAAELRDFLEQEDAGLPPGS